jgi:hypothetical protein
MRLPWIKVYQDGLVKCRTLARLLKIPTAHGIGIGNMIWSWGLDMAPENDAGDIDLRGHLVGDPAELIAAAVEWDGDQQRLWQVLCQVGLCAEAKGATPARIKGLKLYAEVLEERKRDRDRKKGLAPPEGVRRNSGGHPGESHRQIEIEIEIDLQKKKALRFSPLRTLRLRRLPLWASSPGCARRAFDCTPS